MNRLRSDVLAVSCILAGAAAGGGATWWVAQSDGAEPEPPVAVEAPEVPEVAEAPPAPGREACVRIAAPRVVVSMGRGEEAGRVVIRRPAAVGTSCENLVGVVTDGEIRVHLEGIRSELDRARRDMERARVRLEGDRLIRLQRAAGEARLRALDVERLERGLEQRLDRDMKLLEEALTRVGPENAGGGR